MEPDDAPDFLSYLQRSYVLSQPPPAPTDAQLAADALQAYGAQRDGSTPPTGATGVSPSQTPVPLSGLYHLGATAMNGGDVGDPSDLYDDSLPATSAAARNPYFVQTAYHPGQGASAPQAPSATNGPPPLPPQLQGQGGALALAPTLSPGWLPALSSQLQLGVPPSRPSPQQQAAAQAALQNQGRTPSASYTDPYLDAEANIAQGRAIAPGEPQPDLGGWDISADAPNIPRKKKLLREDANLLQDPKVRAYLDTVAFTEGYFNGTPTAYNSREGDGFAGKRLLFGSYDTFPIPQGAKFNGKPQSAAGRYQITSGTYDDFQGRLGIRGFSPQEQDLIAVQILRESHILDHILSGDLAGAVDASSGRWPSMPQYVGGQWRQRHQDQKAAPFDAIQSYYNSRLQAYSPRP